jgi:hypothetical protein
MRKIDKPSVWDLTNILEQILMVMCTIVTLGVIWKLIL